MNAICLYANVCPLAPFFPQAPEQNTHQWLKNIETSSRNGESRNRSYRSAIECVDICFMFVFFFSIFFMRSIKTDYLLQKALSFLVPFYSTIGTHTYEDSDKVCVLCVPKCSEPFCSHVRCYAFAHKLTVEERNIRLHIAHSCWSCQSKRENDMERKHSIVVWYSRGVPDHERGERTLVGAMCAVRRAYRRTLDVLPQ